MHAVLDCSWNALTAQDCAAAAPRYWLRFTLLGGPDLLLYAVRRGRWAHVGRAGMAMLVYWAVVAWRVSVAPAAAIWTLVVPYLITSAALMFGNWQVL